MAYRTLSLRAPCVRISALSARSSSLLTTSTSYSLNSRPFPPRLLPLSTSNHPQSTTATSQSWVNWKALKKIGLVVGFVAGSLQIWSYFKNSKPGTNLRTNLPSATQCTAVNGGPLLSNLPREPSHFFQPRKGDVRKLGEKFRTLEKNNPGDVAKTVYLTGDPATGKTQLAGQFGGEFYEKNKLKNKNLVVGTLQLSNFLPNYLQLAFKLGCVSEETERAIQQGSEDLDELNSLEMLSRRVQEALNKRPGWLLIIDGLSLEEKLVKKFSPFWPQPKEKSWGKGCVLITTQGHAPEGSCINVMDLRSGMTKEDAVELLTSESGCSDKEGAVEVVNSLDRSPLSVACAGSYIKSKRSRDSSYSFMDYMEELTKEEGAQDRIEQQVLKRQQHPFPRTRKTAIRMAAEQLASNNPSLRKVFVLLAACAQAPVPLSLVARVLGVQPDSSELEDIRNCALLSPPSTGLGNIETVSVHQVTRSVFKDLFLQDVSTSAVSEQKNDIDHIIDCVCQEFDTNISSSDSVTFQMMRLLISHIESLLQIHSDFSPDAGHEVQLRFTLGQSYKKMGRYVEARKMLEKVLVVCNKEDIRETGKGAGIFTELGLVYRELGMFKESEYILKEALGTFTKLYGEESVEVAEVLNLLGVTYYRSSQLQESRECYERALEIYKKLCGHKHPSVAMVLVNLGNLWKEEGDKAKAVNLYLEALTIQNAILGHNILGADMSASLS